MNISSGKEIAGFPAVKLRSLFRKIWDTYIGVDYTAYYLSINPRKAKQLLLQLEKEGFLEIDADASERNSKTYWKPTVKGMGLAMASAARPIKRATAERLLSEFLESVKEVNNSPEFLFKVTEVILFGSYLDKSRSTLGDLDLAIKLEPKETDLEKHTKMFLEQATNETPEWMTFVDQTGYPRRKVYRRLKNKSRAISLHATDEPVLSTGIPTKVIFP